MIALTQVRRMTTSDLEDVVAIENASFSAPWSERTFRLLLGRKSACLLVAENAFGEDAAAGDAPAGTTPYETAESDPAGTTPSVASRIAGYAVAWFVGPEGELGNLAVRPEWRGRGLGSTLLQAVMSEARERGVESLFLEVRVSNDAARQLYERAGFEAVGLRPAYYVNPSEDALVMRVGVTPHLR